MKIENHLYVVTGAGSGLGLATSHRLHSLGASVALFDLNSESGQALANELGPERSRFWQCDVGDEDSVEQAFEGLREWVTQRQLTWGGVVHAGGVGMVGKTIDRDLEPFSYETFRAVHRINLDGSFLIASRVASEIAKQRKGQDADLSKPENAVEHEGDRGVIILTSSVSATEGQMGQLAYASSKAAVEGLVLPMSRDLARYGIRVVCIAPSLFSTNMGKNTSDKTRNSLLATTLFPPRFGIPEEFAHLAQAVIENGYLNGTVIRIDGGGRMAKM
ncbi:uncharacterized protein JCM15063_006458 [Sporobolomyces koalae]|uniref:uncharacterized protein n=1 Tax=Sporobolomyces koalae TaxID=500713 RepID=UPI0031822E22